MRAHKYRRNYNTFWIKHGFDPWKYHRESLKYHERLPSGYKVNQTWGAIHKAWVGYCIAINKFEPEKEIYYAKVIQKLQKELGLEVSEFECLS
jgi:hypothetical protein